MARAGGGGQLAVKQHAVLLPGIFYSLFPCFLFKSNPRCQLHPRCAPRRHWEPLGCWPRISCFQKGFFWQLWGGMALGWPQSLQEGRTDGRTDPPRGEAAARWGCQWCVLGAVVLRSCEGPVGMRHGGGFTHRFAK